MERFTESIVSIREDTDLQAALDRLAYYEDMEEQGKLIKIPDEAYYINDGEIKCGRVLAVACNLGDVDGDPIVLYTLDRDDAAPFLGIFGKNVFTSASECTEELELF
jgi:hypothetical protein